MKDHDPQLQTLLEALRTEKARIAAMHRSLTTVTDHRHTTDREVQLVTLLAYPYTPMRKDYAQCFLKPAGSMLTT